MGTFTGSTSGHLEQQADRMPELRAQAYCWAHGRSGILSFLCWSDQAREAAELLFECADDPGYVADLCMERGFNVTWGTEEERNSTRASTVGMALDIFGCLPAAA